MTVRSSIHIGRLLLALSLLLIPAAIASPLELRLVAAKITTDSEGKEQRIPAEAAKPGDLIEYRLFCSNNGPTALGSVKPVIPVPPGMTLVENSAVPAAEMFSRDGKDFVPVAAWIKAKEKPAAIRALRWHLPSLAPGQTQTLSIRTRVQE